MGPINTINSIRFAAENAKAKKSKKKGLVQLSSPYTQEGNTQVLLLKRQAILEKIKAAPNSDALLNIFGNGIKAAETSTKLRGEVAAALKEDPQATQPATQALQAQLTQARGIARGLRELMIINLKPLFPNHSTAFDAVLKNPKTTLSGDSMLKLAES